MTFQERLCGAVAYKRSKPGAVSPFTPSAAQVEIREWMAEAVAAWKALEPAQREQWNDYITG